MNTKIIRLGKNYTEATRWTQQKQPIDLNLADPRWGRQSHDPPHTHTPIQFLSFFKSFQKICFCQNSGAGAPI